MIHKYSKEEIIEFIRKNPGLTEAQICSRIGKNIRTTLKNLYSIGEIKYEKNFNPLSMRTCRQIFLREKKA